METERSGGRSPSEASNEELSDFLGFLNELKATGCNLLVVGNARPELFDRASAHLFGDSNTLRYRLLAVTDAGPRSVSERLPDPTAAVRSLAETTRVVNHAASPRSAAASEPPTGPTAGIDPVPETRVGDRDLEGLETALLDGIEEFADRSGELRPAQLRVGVDSVGTLLDQHSADDVCRCLRSVGERVHRYDAMAHYVLPEPYENGRVQALAEEFDAVIELRSVNPDRYGHDAQQRWHVPDRDLTMSWVRL